MKTRNKRADNQAKPKNRACVYYGLNDVQKKLYSLSRNGHKFNNLYRLIQSNDNILMAYRCIKNNKGANTPGVDRITKKQVARLGADKLIKMVQKRLANYKPQAIKRKYIPKKNGKRRPLGIPTFIERVIEQAIRQILEPILEAKFHNMSFGFRPNRSQHHAIQCLNQMINKGYHYVVDIDIKSYFDNVDHSKLIKILWNNGIQDQKVLEIIAKRLKAPIENEGIPSKGVPQGGVISPLLANIYLNELDQWIANQWQRFPLSQYYKNKTKLKRGLIIRFADDIKILARNKSEAIKWLHAAKLWLKENLLLDISEEKSGIVNIKRKSTHFLGIEIRLSKSKKKQITRPVAVSSIGREEIKKITQRYKEEAKDLINSGPNAAEIEKFMSYIRGVRNYFSIATNVYKNLARVDYNVWKWRNRLKRRVKIIRQASEHCKASLALSYEAKYTFPKPPSQDSFLDNFNLSIEIYDSQLKWIRQKIQSNLNDYTVEKADIILSLYTQQRGLDPITRLPLNDWHCHRKTPGYKGGEYTFKNCVLLNKFTHQIVHGTKETLTRFIQICKLGKKKTEKLTKLWLLAN